MSRHCNAAIAASIAATIASGDASPRSWRTSSNSRTGLTFRRRSEPTKRRLQFRWARRLKSRPIRGRSLAVRSRPPILCKTTIEVLRLIEDQGYDSRQRFPDKSLPRRMNQAWESAGPTAWITEAHPNVQLAFVDAFRAGSRCGPGGHIWLCPTCDAWTIWPFSEWPSCGSPKSSDGVDGHVSDSRFHAADKWNRRSGSAAHQLRR